MTLLTDEKTYADTRIEPVIRGNHIMTAQIVL